MKSFKRSFAVIMALVLCLGMTAVPAMAGETPLKATIEFTLASEGTLEVYPTELEVTDVNNDGALTAADALIAGHDAFFEGGAEEGLVISESGWITKMWGIANSGYGYYINDIACGGISDPIADGDSFYAFVYQDTTFWSDMYAYFDKKEVSVYANYDTELTLTATAWGGTENPEGVVLYSEEAPEEYFVTDENGMVTINLAEAGTYVFVSYSDDEDLVLTPAVVKVNVKDFADVTEEHWAYDDVVEAVNAGIAEGISNTEFDPDGELTRAMWVTEMYRLSKADGAEEAAAFADVPDDAYYADAVAWASEQGIVKGYSEKKFGPDDKVTREQAAVMLYRFAKYAGYDTSDTNDLEKFSDADSVSAWAKDAMGWAVEKGILKGCRGKICPIATSGSRGGMTRAEGTAVVVRFNRVSLPQD